MIPKAPCVCTCTLGHGSQKPALGTIPQESSILFFWDRGSLVKSGWPSKHQGSNLHLPALTHGCWESDLGAYISKVHTLPIAAFPASRMACEGVCKLETSLKECLRPSDCRLSFMMSEACTSQRPSIHSFSRRGEDGRSAVCVRHMDSFGFVTTVVCVCVFLHTRSWEEEGLKAVVMWVYCKQKEDLIHPVYHTWEPGFAGLRRITWLARSCTFLLMTSPVQWNAGYLCSGRSQHLESETSLYWMNVYNFIPL